MLHIKNLRCRFPLAPGVLLFALATASHAGEGDVAIGGRALGTFYAVTLAAPVPESSRARLAGCVAAALGRIDELMSTWRDDSELARLNANRSGDWLPVSPAILAVLHEARAVSGLTGGAFDVTVAPLLALWGLGPAAREGAPLPTPRQVTRELARVGYRDVALREHPPALRKARGDMALDLSAIAKGFAVDVLAALLERHGIESYLVNVGGEMRARGGGRDGAGWRVGIERPGADAPAVARVLSLRRVALATSGTYRRYREVAGRRIADTIDPRTGAPVSHDLRSVTVIASRAMTADALATGLLVLGPEDGPRLARERGIAALFVSGESGSLRARVSPAFEALERDGASLDAPDDADAMRMVETIGCGV